jgi:hypothetical protein
VSGFWPDEPEQDWQKSEALAEEVRTLFEEYFRIALLAAGQWQRKPALPEERTALSYYVGARLQVGSSVKQHLLETPTTQARLEMERSLLKGTAHRLSRTVAAKIAEEHHNGLLDAEMSSLVAR